MGINSQKEETRRPAGSLNEEYEYTWIASRYHGVVAPMWREAGSDSAGGYS